MTRAERAAEAVALRAQGLVYREIAERMGVSRTYAQQLVRDPDGGGVRARKASYAGTCTRCGRATSGSNGRAKAPTICAECEHQRSHAERHWTPERIVAAMRVWTDHYGQPPIAIDWTNGSGIGAEPLEWPPTSVVIAELGWNAALRLAGLPVQREFETPAYDDPTVKQRAAQRYLDGLSLEAVGVEFGVSSTRVAQWMEQVGVPRRPPGTPAPVQGLAA